MDIAMSAVLLLAKWQNKMAKNSIWLFERSSFKELIQSNSFVITYDKLLIPNKC